MTEITEKKERVKKDVRSLLLSSPLPLTVKELQNDFQNIVGAPIDFRGIGYPTLEDFLRDIEDAVDISWDRGIMVLKAKANIADQHIQKLVSKQKVPNKHKYAVNRRSDAWSGPPRIFQGESRAPRQKQGALLPPAPVVPAYIRNELWELVNSYPDGIVLTNFNNCYYKQFGARINFHRYGFHCLNELLMSLSNTVIIKQLANGEQLVLPLSHSQRPCFGAARPDGHNEFRSKDNRLTFKECVQYSNSSVSSSVEKKQRPCFGASPLDCHNDKLKSKDNAHTFEEHFQYSTPTVLSSLVEKKEQRPCSSTSLDSHNDKCESKDNRPTFKERVQYSNPSVSSSLEKKEQRPCSSTSLDSHNDKCESKDNRPTFKERVQYSNPSVSSSLEKKEQRPCSSTSLDSHNDKCESKDNRPTFKERVQYSNPSVSSSLEKKEQRPCSSTSLDSHNDKCESKDNRPTFEEHFQCSTPTVSSSLEENRKQRPGRGRGQRFFSMDNMCSRDETIGSKTSLANGQTTVVDQFKDVVELTLEMEIKQVLEMFPAGIWACNFTFEYQRIFGKTLDFRVLGYFSVIDMIASIPNVARIERPDPKGDWMLYDIRLPRPKISDTKQSKSDAIKEDIQKVLHANPSGLLVKEFSCVFEDYTGREFHAEDLGFSSLNDLFLSLADSSLQIAYTGPDGLKVYPKEAKLPSNTAPEKPLSPNVIGVGCRYTQVKCPQPNKFVDLFVSNIVNPGIFWVIFRDKSMSLALETLMDNLESVYRDDFTDYKMPESLMVTGQVCAAIFPEDNNWHRCVITKPCSKKGFAEVYYVDYGNCNEVHQNNIRFLRTEFFVLPAQAVQCRLANIHPVTKSVKWTNNSKDRMLELCKVRPLVAYVCDVKNQIMSLCLVNTNDPNINIHINDILVNEGHALFKPDTEVPPEWLIYSHTKVPDYSLVFGHTIPEIPRLPKLAHHSLIETKKDVGSASGHCYVQWVQLTKDHMIHLINLERVAYIISSEISSLYWEDDILTSMLQQKKMNMNKRQINSAEYPELFQKLLKFRVKSLKADGKCQYLSLFALDSVPAILETFGPDDKDLINAVKQLVTQFDPDSPCWKSDNQDKFKNIEEAAEDNCIEVHLSIEEKQMLLQTLQFKRKRILQLLMNGTSIAADNTVNQLDDVETKITMIKEEIEEQTLQETVTHMAERKTKTTDVQLDQVEESQRHILNIIASATKPIATANIMTKAITTTTGPKPSMNVIGSSNQPIIVNNFITQTQIGSNYPDMKAVSASNYSLLPQAGPSLGGGTGDMENLGASINMFPGTNFANVLNPLLFQPFQTASANPTSLSISNMESCNPFLSFGRGTALDPTSVGILPGLLPLIKNLKVGQWGRGKSDSNND